MIYIITLTVFVFLGYFQLFYTEKNWFDVNYKRLNFFLLAIAFLYLCFFAGYRLVGYDYGQYRDFLKVLTVNNYSDYTVELGYAAINQISRSLGFGFHFYLFLLALITVGLKFYFFDRFSPYSFFSLVIYFPITFMISDMGQIRNGLAMSIALIAFLFFFEKKNLWFAVLTFIAILFHSSALILFGAWIFCRFKFCLHPVFVLFSLAFCSFFLFYDIANLLQLLPGFIGSSQLNAKISLYTGNEEFMKSVGLSATTVLRLFVLGVMFFLRKKGVTLYRHYDDLLKLYFFGVLIFMVFSSIGEFAFRFSNYFKLLECVILPVFIYIIQEKRLRLLTSFLCVVFAYYSLYKLIGDPEFSESFIPYKNTILSSF